MQVIDTHAHLDEDAFSVDRDEVVARAVDAGVRAIITIGTTAASSRQAVKLAARYAPVYAAVGIQPNYAAEARPGDWEIIEQLSGESKVVAIGETGLDRYWDYAPFDMQQEYFARHLELARRRDLPFVVHCRDADKDVISQMRAASAAGVLRGVMHSFSGSLESALACVELGLHISFAGMLTFKKNADLRAAAATVPRDRLLVETDSPYLAPTPYRGKRNEPAFVVHTLGCLADACGMTVEDAADVTTRNAAALFRI